MTGNAYQQVEAERKTRWARRDFSPHALTEMERAERRHYRANKRWMSALWLTPLFVSAALGLPLGEWETPVLVGMSTFFAWALALLSYMIAGWIIGEPGARTVFWISAGTIAIAGVGLFMLLFVVAAEAPLFTGLLVSALLPVWPFVWRHFRNKHVTDYERLLDAAATPPPGIVE